MNLKDYYRYGSMLIQARRDTIIWLVWGVTLSVMGGLGLIPFLSDFKPGALPFIVLMAAVLVAGLIILIPNLMVCIKPETSKKIKNIDNLQGLLEDLDKNEIYKDGFFNVSEKAIYSTFNPLMISERNDVLAAWVQINKNYGMEAGRAVTVCTVTGDYRLPLTVGGQGAQQQIFITLTKYCPNCKIGFSNANKKYVSDVRKDRMQARKG